MSHETPRVEYYDSSIDDVFSTALVRYLFEPARKNLQRQEQPYNLEGPYHATSVATRLSDGVRFEYDFYADKTSPHIIMHALRFDIIDNISPEAAELLLRALPTSDLEAQKIVEYVTQPSKLLDNAQIEQYVGHTFEINTDANIVTVKTDIGIYVDGAEIDIIPVEDQSNIDIDDKRQTIFEIDVLGELMHSLYRMHLVEQSEVDDFLRSVGLLKFDDL